MPRRLLRIIAPEKFDDKGNLKSKALEKNGAVLSTYGGFIIKQLGTINIPCKYKEREINCIFYVTDTLGPAILGLIACIALKVVSLQCTLNSFNAPAQNSGNNRKSLNTSHSKAFEKVKLLICTTTTLAYYDTKKPVALHVDASSKGYWQWFMVAKSSIRISMEDRLWLEQTIAP